ncbi:unnamed protein product, partial [Iphiclides podalirius]
MGPLWERHRGCSVIPFAADQLTDSSHDCIRERSARHCSASRNSEFAGSEFEREKAGNVERNAGKARARGGGRGGAGRGPSAHMFHRIK